MANITKRANKDGSASYRVKVSAGVGADGRYIYRSATYTPPPKLSARKEAKAVQEFADDFERRVQEGLFVANDLTVDGLAERWMKTYCEKQLKPHTVSDYQKMLPRVSAAIGHIKLANLRPGHIQEFYNRLAQPGIREDGKYRHGLHLLRLSQKVHGWPCYMPLMYHSAHLRKQCAGVMSLSVQPKR